MWQSREDESLIYLWDGIAREYTEIYGAPPFNVSHWDTLWELPVFRPATLSSGDIIRYAYSYYLDAEDPLLAKLGFDPPEKSLLVTPNGTLSMLALLSYAAEVREVAALDVFCPFYYSLERQASRTGIELRYHYMQRQRGRYRIPRDVLHRPGVRAVWVTNPVFSASVYLDPRDREELRGFLARGGIVIADESLSLPGCELARELGESPGFWGIYTPQKGLGTNGLKFSAAVVQEDAWQYFELWSDAFAGSLNAAAAVAVRHFLSPDFEVLDAWFRREIAHAWRAVARIAADFPAVTLDDDPQGHFVMCYAPHIPAEQARDPAFFRSVVNRSGATFIPGVRNRYDPRLGLSFRINLARRCGAFDSSLTRLLGALSHEAKG
jgi:hypothetical protein